MKPIMKFTFLILTIAVMTQVSCKKERPIFTVVTPPPPLPPPANVSSNEIIFIQEWKIDPVNNIVSMVLLPVGFSIDSLLGVYLEVYEMLMPEWIEISKNGTEPNKTFYKIENNSVILYVTNPSYLAFMNVNKTVKLVFS